VCLAGPHLHGGVQPCASCCSSSQHMPQQDVGSSTSLAAAADHGSSSCNMQHMQRQHMQTSHTDTSTSA
jgi:hypothetical protein